MCLGVIVEMIPPRVRTARSRWKLSHFSPAVPCPIPPIPFNQYLLVAALEIGVKYPVSLLMVFKIFRNQLVGIQGKLSFEGWEQYPQFASRRVSISPTTPNDPEE